MRSLRRVLPAGWRLFRGSVASAGRSIPWSSIHEITERADVVSFDVFGTILSKPADLDQDVRLSVARRIAEMLEDRDLPGWDEGGVRRRLDELEGRLGREALEQGKDPEIPRRRLYGDFFASALGGGLRGEEVDRILEYEIDRYHEGTAVDPEVRGLLDGRRRAGKRLVVISDTFLGADGIESLLRKHGIEGLDAIYASCDFQRGKLHGGLFEEALSRENVDPGQMVHIGDDRLADLFSARSLGVVGVRRPGVRRGLPSSGFRLGYETLGPIFAAFSHLLLLEVGRSRFSRLAFVARDGDFLRAATARLIGSAPLLPRPALEYVYLSRRATALAGRPILDEAALEEVRSVRAEGPFEDLFLDYFGLERDALPAGCGGPASIAALLREPEFQAFVQSQREQQTALLRDYLRQTRLFGESDVALVDVGWRGSTQRDLNEAFGLDPNFARPPFYYLALWSESGPVPDPKGPAIGILGDQRRSRSIREAAAWHLAFLIESVCRASHGTVSGFSRQSDTVRPRLAGDSRGRRSEAAAEPYRDEIRNGILSYVDGYGKRLRSPAVDERALRQSAQRRMLRLAFFPRPWELDSVGQLVQTEGHAEEWAAPLVVRGGVHPLRSPRRWMAGLTSPWRAGYVAATGGYPFAAAYFFLESLLVAAPAAFRRRLREWALKMSGASAPRGLGEPH